MTEISAPSTDSATLNDVATRTDRSTRARPAIDGNPVTTLDSAKRGDATVIVNPATTMDPATLLFADLDTEMATTRRMLERVPDGKDDWRPHKKSRTLDELATHIAQLPGLGILMLTRDEYDGGTRSPEPKPSRCSERLEIFDDVSREFTRLVKAMTWEQAMSPWTMKFRGQVVFRTPRAQLLRSAMLTHLAHHRAQLGVYLRLLDIPVPGSYGPTADDGPPSR
jgi:uncharacterized damage-inducible protein DinB